MDSLFFGDPGDVVMMMMTVMMMVMMVVMMMVMVLAWTDQDKPIRQHKKELGENVISCDVNL